MSMSTASELLNVLLGRPEPIHIRTPPTSDQLLLIKGRGAVSSSRRPLGNEGGEFSHHECVGDESSVKPRTLRACLFHRICLDTRNGEFTYHRRAHVTQAPVLFDRRYGHTFAFRHVSPKTAAQSKRGADDFVGLNKHVRYKQHVRWSPRVVDRPLPADAVRVETLQLLSAPFVPTNLGHLVWEESFPLLLAMAQLGAYESSAAVLRTHGCNESVSGAPPSPSEALLCSKFAEGFLRPLQAEPCALSLEPACLEPACLRACVPACLHACMHASSSSPPHPPRLPRSAPPRARPPRFALS